VCLPASKIGNRPCRYNGEIDKLGAFNYLTSEGKIIILLLLTKPYTFAQSACFGLSGSSLDNQATSFGHYSLCWLYSTESISTFEGALIVTRLYKYT
jgi:hypothetical protein